MRETGEMIIEKEREFNYFKDGDKFEGDFKNDKKEGTIIFYYNNGNRKMGFYMNDKPIGKHVKLTKDGRIKVKIYSSN